MKGTFRKFSNIAIHELADAMRDDGWKNEISEFRVSFFSVDGLNHNVSFELRYHPDGPVMVVMTHRMEHVLFNQQLIRAVARINEFIEIPGD